MKISKNRFLLGAGFVILLLGIMRCAAPHTAKQQVSGTTHPETIDIQDDSALQSFNGQAADTQTVQVVLAYPKFFHADGRLVKNRIYSVPNFGKAFPDQNDVQLISAQKYGVRPVQNRQEAEHRKGELTYIGSNPYYYVDNLKSSIPYLVPRAAILLQDIGHNFFDSLQIKGIPLHKIIVTSVMRSKEDVQKLRNHNHNATQNSCHLYGTTVDVCYNRYKTVETTQEPRRKVRNDTLKWVLSEVLNDLRLQNRCHIKYEVHQGCFHLTVR